MRLSRGMNCTNGSVSDFAIHSPTGIVSSNLPLRTSSAISQQLIEEIQISLCSFARSISPRARSESCSGLATHQIQAWVSRTINEATPSLRVQPAPEDRYSERRSHAAPGEPPPGQ